MYKYHPEIDGLKVNEDGTEVILNGKKLVIKAIKLKGETQDMLYVNYIQKTLSIAKLVCECWNGMADNPRWVAKRKVLADGFHYTNLYFEGRGFKPSVAKNRKKTRSKIKDADVPVIKKRLAAGETLKAIAKDYKTSARAISRIKNLK